ncbi:hypothetical protein [Streptomyces sp. NPDC001070]
MAIIQRTALVSAAAAAVLGIATSAPASAASVAPHCVHRGSVGCFTYSWGDGSITWTIYHHNTCDTRAPIAGTTNALFDNKWCAVVGANGKGDTVVWNEPMTFAASRGDHC